MMPSRVMLVKVERWPLIETFVAPFDAVPACSRKLALARRVSVQVSS